MSALEDFDAWSASDAGKPSAGSALSDFDAWAKNEAQPTSLRDTAIDTAKSLGAGAERGTIGLAGLPGDVREMVSNAASSLSKKLGYEVSPESISSVLRRATPLKTPTTSELTKGVESVTGPIYEPKTTAGKYGRTVGEFAPGALLPGGLAARIGRVIVPAVSSEAAGQATEGTQAEPVARFAGALAPGALSAVPGVVRGALTGAPSAARQAALRTLESEGVDSITAGQRTGAYPLRYAERITSDAPFSGSPAHDVVGRGLEQVSGAVLRRAGITDATRATPLVIEGAFNRIGGEIGRLGRTYDPEITPAVWDRLERVRRSYLSETSPSVQVERVSSLINEIGEAAVNNHGILPGRVYTNWRSDLSRLIRGSGQDWKLRDAYSGIQRALDTAFERSIRLSGNVEDLGAYRTARRQYRNLLDIARMAAKPGEQAAEGLLTPAALRSEITRGDRNKLAYARGIGDFADLSHAANTVMLPLNSSNTAQYAQVVGGLTGLGALGYGAATGDWKGAGYGALGLAAPAVAARGLMSRPVQRYLASPARQSALPNILPGLLPRRAPVSSLVPYAAEDRERAEGGRALRRDEGGRSYEDLLADAKGSVDRPVGVGPKTLGEKLGETWPARAAKAMWSGATLPGDVYAGRVDPNSDEAIGRSVDLAGLAMTGGIGGVGRGAGEALNAGFGRRMGPADFERLLNARRATEGFRAAMRDPETGKVYTGSSHQAAINSVPTSDKSGAWGRLSGEWDRSTSNAGFIDSTGKFISRDEAEKRFGILTMEDLRDLRAKTLGSGATDKRSSAAVAGLQGIRAYHGSPYDFDKFDLAKIGTGEGAQAYGHGLYFAENPKVAEEYKRALSHKGVNLETPKKYFPEHEWTQQDLGRIYSAAINNDPDPLKAARAFQMRMPEFRDEGYSFIGSAGPKQQKLAELIDSLRQQGRGRMYEVNLRARPEDFLDWDRPLGAQSAIYDKLEKLPQFQQQRAMLDNERLAAAAKKIGIPPLVPLKIQTELAKGAPFPEAAAKVKTLSDNPEWAKHVDALSALVGDRPISMLRMLPAEWTGQSISKGVNELKSRDVAGILRDQGIPGIRYLDQGSRFQPQQIEHLKDQISKLSAMDQTNPSIARALAGRKAELDALKPTSNYVVFDPGIIDILRKYALGGAT